MRRDFAPRALALGSLLLGGLLFGAEPPPDLWGDTPSPHSDGADGGAVIGKPKPAKPAQADRVPGHLEGKIENADLVKRIFAVDRSLVQAFIENSVKTIEIEGTLDKDKKTYAFPTLPEGDYDLKLELADGRIIEGCDMRPAGPSVDPLTHDDREKIKKTFAAMRQFTDENTIWHIEGNGQYATVLIELVRHNKTSLNAKVDGEDFVIWRVELWQYQKNGDVWEHQHSQVLRRLRPSVSDFAVWNIQYQPDLGGVKIEPHRMTFKDIVAPRVSDVTCGRFSRAYTNANRQAGPLLHAGIECKVMLVDPETGTIVVDAGSAQTVTKGMEAWVYDAKGEKVIAKGPVTRVDDAQTTAAIPGLKARLPEVDPDDPYDKQGNPKLPEALKDLKEGTKVRLVPLPD